MSDCVGCQRRRGPGAQSLSLLAAVVFAALDIGITMGGIVDGLGYETNPLFAPFTRLGVPWMLGGLLVYLCILFVVYSWGAYWLQATVTGVLIAVHTFGVLSWIRLGIYPPANILFTDPFYSITGPAVLAALGTIASYVDLTSCSLVRPSGGRGRRVRGRRPR